MENTECQLLSSYKFKITTVSFYLPKKPVSDAKYRLKQIIFNFL